ncbi:restriction endonuclease subunit S [Desulforamulus ruminis]|uniref:restriction endonuclease subunit S n=1 Tax=Desulforamulus ruminis TaxID=1564 RepID=UPI002FDA22F2
MKAVNKMISEFTEVVTGGTPSTSKVEYWDGNIPWLNSGILNDGDINKPSRYITELGLKNSNAKLMPPHTVLIALTGATTGQVGYLQIAATANQSVTGILPSKEHYARYLYYYLRTQKKKIRGDAFGGAQPHINQQYVKNIQVPLPSLDDQIRVATVLTRVEKLIAKRKESIKLLDEFLQSIFLEIFGDPVRNEKGWEKKCINEFAEVRIGPFGSLLHAEDYIENGIPIINPSRIIDGKIIPDYKLTISFEKIKELESYQLKLNDIVVARRGEIGRCAIVRTAEPLVCGTGSMFIRINNNYLPLLLHHQIYNTSLKEYLENQAKGVTMKNLNSITLGNLQVLYPPFSLQKQFGDIVQKVEALKARYAQSLMKLETLYNSFSQRAFKGEVDLSKIPVDVAIEPEVTMDVTNLLESPALIKFSQKELMKIIKTLFDRPFNFNKLWKKVEQASFEPAPEYEEIKDMIYTMLKGKNPVLKQSFEEVPDETTGERIKKIVLRVNV